jgi:hypothetical protein
MQNGIKRQPVKIGESVKQRCGSRPETRQEYEESDSLGRAADYVRK